MNEKRLIARIRHGDEAALNALIRTYYPSVRQYVSLKVPVKEDAQDITQDTFVRVWEKAGQYRPQGKPLSWMLAIARNLALMKLRSARHTDLLPDEEWVLVPAPDSPLTAEDRHLLELAVNALADEERRVVMLHAVAGLKHREIADLLEMPLATVLSKYHRALKKLNNRLKGDGAQ